MDLIPPKHRVEDVVEKHRKDDNAKGVKVVDNVVGHAVGGEHGRQETRRIAQSIVVDKLDGKEAEDSRGLERAAHVLDELVVPASTDGLALALGCDYRGLRGVPETVPADAEDPAVAEADLEDTDDVGEVGAARRMEDEALAEPVLETFSTSTYERRGCLPAEQEEESTTAAAGERPATTRRTFPPMLIRR
jgi:hypothetical protein